MSAILLIFVRHWFFEQNFRPNFFAPSRGWGGNVRPSVRLYSSSISTWGGFSFVPDSSSVLLDASLRSEVRKKPRKKIFFDRKRFSSSSVQLRLSFSQEGFDEERQKLSCFFCFVSSCSGPFSPVWVSASSGRRPSLRRRRNVLRFFQTSFFNETTSAQSLCTPYERPLETFRKKRTDISILRPFGRKAEIFGPDPVSHRLRSHLDREEPGWRLHDRCAAAGEVPKIFLFVCVLAHQTFLL